MKRAEVTRKDESKLLKTVYSKIKLVVKQIKSNIDYHVRISNTEER